MSFIKLILKNLFKKRKKAMLTILILIMIVLLISILSVFMSTFEEINNKSITGTGDFLVLENRSVNELYIGAEGVIGSGNNTDNFDPLNQTFINEFLNNLSHISGVKKIILKFNEIEEKEGFTTYYFNSSDLHLLKINYIEGHQFSNSSEIIISKDLSNQLNKTTGDSLKVSNKTYTISGIYNGNLSFDYGCIASIDNVNLIKDSKQIEFELPYSISFIGFLDDGANKTKVKNEINNLDKHMKAVFSVKDVGVYQSFYNFMSEIVLVINIVSIAVGCIIVTHTILSSVNERAREISILKSDDLSNKRIILMIISESLVLCFIAGILGIIVSIVLINIIFHYILIAIPVYDWSLIIEILIIVMIISLVGSILPAIRAVRNLAKSPTDR
ncbi:ABC transporter permease [Methanobrevibacter filiformis]|uniref:Macrolide transporter ATP-binding /permease protein n=1 Tax=Methanobrevibacter filiformis TaxID=55758 RepID=A0A166C813_9EURY|nr:FtsX-like permease family protein [Methanobrevibacter filiformis]KZX12067.1 macrolide transporter ATP-binding /permease protein [Methanobrevibacter filiformis]